MGSAIRGETKDDSLCLSRAPHGFHPLWEKMPCFHTLTDGGVFIRDSGCVNMADEKIALSGQRHSRRSAAKRRLNREEQQRTNRMALHCVAYRLPDLAAVEATWFI